MAIFPLGGRGADSVQYDNATSGLSAVNVQAAIDELAAETAADLEYDNAITGLAAVNVQDAIDELAVEQVDVAILRSNLNLSATATDTNPRIGSSAGAIASGTCFFTFFTPLTSRTVSQISMSSAGTAAAGLTYAAMGLYTFDGTTATLVARTASDTTLFNSTFTLYTRAFDTAGGFPATYDLVAGERYALGTLIVGTTAPSVYHSTGFVPNSLNTLDPRMSGSATSQTALPTSRNTFSSTTVVPWARFS